MAKTSQSKATDSASKGQTGYTVLARRYRSRDFDELIGQEPIAKTLRNAIKTNRTAHAYLFCGTRGVGKTSMARIFAKALNATDELSQQNEIAEAILRGDDLDVIEIDGASYRGINEARELIAGAGLSPARCQYKIYIIDEVHQLTKDAFNALLKTMEEPPSHVKFILCTTEANKVPATIQSRCQRFDFRPIPTKKIADQLKNILKQESITADDEVVSRIASLGNGSMRDALSLMDRILSAQTESLTIELVEEMLGLPDHTRVANVVNAVISSDATQAIQAGNELLSLGTTVDEALNMLAEHFRTLLVIAVCGNESDVLELSEENRRIAVEHASQFDPPTLVHMIALCDAASRNARGSTTSRALFDAVLVRLCLRKQFAGISDALKGQSFAGAAPKGLASSPEPKKKEVAVVNSPSPKGDLFATGTTVTEVKSTSDAQGTAVEFWARVVEVAQESMSDRVRIEHLSCKSFDGTTLRLAVDEHGADVARYLSRETDRLADLVKRATGQKVDVRIEVPHKAVSSRAQSSSSRLAEAQKNPLIKKAIETFDARVVAVEDVDKSNTLDQPEETDNV